MTNRPYRLGPLALTNTLTTNILNPGTTTGGVNSGTFNLYIIIYRFNIFNKTASPATFSLWIGATGANLAGTEFFTAVSVAANSYFPYSGRLRFDVTDFLVGGASANTTLTFEAEGEIGIV